MNETISSKAYARAGGILYLIIIAIGMFEELYIRARVSGGTAAATFANLQKMEMLWRTGVVLEMLLLIATIALALVLYVLTRPVQKELALLALLFNIVAISVEGSYVMQLVEALFPIGGSAYLTAFTSAQLQAMTALAMKTHVFGFGIALLLFCPFFFITGYLIFTSGYVPKPVGVLYVLAGVAYTVNSLVLLLAPQYAGRAFMILAVAFAGEISFALWLLTGRTPQWS